MTTRKATQFERRRRSVALARQRFATRRHQRRRRRFPAGVRSSDSVSRPVRDPSSRLGGREIAFDQTVSGKQEMLHRLTAGDRLLLAWTGRYTTDTFVADELDLVGAALS